MLISKQWRFLFIHIPKTAGLSITRALNPFAENPTRKTPIRRLKSKIPVRQPLRDLYLPIHADMNWVSARLHPEELNPLTSFCVVRNPYDRAISRYHFIKRSKRHHNHNIVATMSFDEFIWYSRKKLKKDCQHKFICDESGKILVDQVLRFENLESDFQNIWKRLMLPGKPELPHRNASSKTGLDYFSSTETQSIVQSAYEKDFEIFGYPK